MAFWKQEWKTHYDPCEQTYNIPEVNIWELLKENQKLQEENDKIKLKLEQEVQFGSGMNGLRARIAKLQKLVDEYKKSSLREEDATPEEITEYMEELSTDLDALQGDYDELVSWEEEVYDAIDHDDDVSRDDVIDFIKRSYDFYDTEMMHELSKEWANVWNCLHQEEENVYRQEGFDPEVDDHELEDGMTYTSMRRITYMIELPCWNGKYRERLGDHIILGDKGAEEGGD